MTLNTKFLTTSPGIDPEELFGVLLGAVEPEDFPIRREDYIESGTDAVDYLHRPDQVTMNSRCGVGLKAWCFITYREDGSPTDAEYDDDYQVSPEHYIRLAFDTAYGYSGVEGSVSGLHNVIIAKLAAYVAEHGGTYIWQNEFTGDWFTDTDSRY